MRLFLEQDNRVQVVALAADGHQAVELAQQLSPRVVVMDLGLPGIDGLEATRRLLQVRPETAVIVLTGRSGDHLSAAARGAGAVGFLTKGGLADTDDLLEEIVTLAPLNRTPA